MANEEYVSYELAKLLKEKGLSKNTISKYAAAGGASEEWYDEYREMMLRFDWEEGYLFEPLTEPHDQYGIWGDTIPAPTYQEAMNSLRKTHSLHITIEPYITTEGVMYAYKIHKLEQDKVSLLKSEAGFESNESACEDAIEHCLENLI